MEEDIFDLIAAGKVPAAAAMVPAPVPQAQLAGAQAQRIGSALARHVPAMQRSFSIITSYGPWHVSGELAEKMAELLRKDLMEQLAALESGQ
ncbi:hypothetical protein SR914_23295 [Comamonas testosteroni]|uniref:Uncharacterized protein n=1 Tax=Comamonas testosteroni (strain DSM 14576 / KF-1) TaxID=399795 RepID=B7WXT5_COMTK|nr:hypothetical protein [Comamonas testosteroni]EED67937.1 hypothetical protein CtesDRAFT_PD2883 [Comamonas testosteroni KF-1]WQG66054.1 hypothetical protein SR914_23295 [Comamonas testosteroni]